MASAEQIKIITNIWTHPAAVISGVKDGLQGGMANNLTATGSALATMDAFVSVLKNVPVIGKVAVAASLAGDLKKAITE